MRSRRPSQPAVFGPGPRAADPVVAHLDGAPVRGDVHPHPGGRGAGVPDHVGECFGAEEVHAGLDRRREPAVRHVELDRDRQPGGEGSDGRGQAALGEELGVDAGHDLAQILKAVPGVKEGPADQFPRLFRRGIPFLLGELKVDQGGDEPLLGAVVQVPGDAPAGRVRGGDQARPRRHQVLLGALPFGDVPEVAGEGGLGGRPGTGHRDLGRELTAVGAHRRHLEPPVQDAPLPGGQVPGETLPVGLPQRRRHDHLAQFPPDHLGGPIAEDLLERAVHVRDPGELVDADDGVERGFQDGPLARLARGEFGRPGLGDVTVPVGLAASQRGDPAGVQPLGRDQLQLGDDGAAQLREHGQQEDLLGRKGFAADDHQEDRFARPPGDERERPARRGAADVELAGLGECGQGTGDAVRRPLVVLSRLAGMPGEHPLAACDRRDRGGDQADELDGRGCLGQDQRQREHRVDRRQLRVDVRRRIDRAGRAPRSR